MYECNTTMQYFYVRETMRKNHMHKFNKAMKCALLMPFLFCLLTLIMHLCLLPSSLYDTTVLMLHRYATIWLPPMDRNKL